MLMYFPAEEPQTRAGGESAAADSKLWEEPARLASYPLRATFYGPSCRPLRLRRDTARLVNSPNLFSTGKNTLLLRLKLLLERSLFRNFNVDRHSKQLPIQNISHLTAS